MAASTATPDVVKLTRLIAAAMNSVSGYPSELRMSGHSITAFGTALKGNPIWAGTSYMGIPVHDDETLSYLKISLVFDVEMENGFGE